MSNNTPVVTVELCMGSSCYSRGNKTLAQELKDLINQRGWSNKVQIKGRLCCNQCSSGPHVHVNGVACAEKTVFTIEQQIGSRLFPATGIPVDCRVEP